MSGDIGTGEGGGAPPPLQENRLWVAVGIVLVAWAAYLTYVAAGTAQPLRDVLENTFRSAQGFVEKSFLTLGWLVGLLTAVLKDRWPAVAASANVDLVLNLLLMVAGGLMTLLFGLPIVALSTQVPGLVPWLFPDRPRSGARAIAFWTLVVAVSFVVLLDHALPPVFKLFGVEGDDSSSAGFFWAEIVLFAAILWIRTLVSDAASAPPAVPARPRLPAEEPKPLEPLYREYLAAGGAEAILFSESKVTEDRSAGHDEKTQPVQFKADPRLGAASTRFLEEIYKEFSLTAAEAEKIQDFLFRIAEDELENAGGHGRWSGHDAGSLRSNIIFEEPLSDLHYRLLAEAAHLAQDGGGSTLLLCPDIAYRPVRDRLRQTFGPHCPDITQTWWCQKDGPFDRSQVYSLMLVTEEGLQTHLIGEQADDFRQVLERLRLLIVVDAHRLDPSLLRLHLALLWTRAPAERVRVIVQGAPRQGVTNLYDGLFGETGRSHHPLSLRAQTRSCRHTLVFRNSRTARDALLARYAGASGERTRHYTGIDLVPLILLPVLRDGFPAVHLEPRDVRGRMRWDDLPLRFDSERWFGSRDLATLLKQVPTLSQPEFRDGSIVALIEDRFNLHDAFADLARTRLPAEMLTLVVSHAYALRDFLADRERLGHAVAGDAGLPFLPIAPRPRGGLRELALVLLLRLVTRPGGDGAAAAPGLTRTLAAAYFQRLGNPALLRAFAFSPTRSGIQALLASQFPEETFEIEKDRSIAGARGPDPSLVRHASFADDVRYLCRNHTRLPASVGAYVPLIRSGVGHSMVGWAPRDDYGLSFAEGTPALVNGRYFKVMNVTRDSTFVESLDNLNAHFPSIQGDVVLRFCRLYTLTLTASTAVLAESPQREMIRPGLQRIHAFLCLPVARATMAYQVMDSLEPSRRGGMAGVTRELDRAAQVRRVHPSVHAAAIRFEIEGMDGLGGEATARVAFTLAALLNDLLECLFPGLGHRLAVLSPQAGPAVTALLKQRDAVAQFLVLRYPRLVPGAPEDLSAPPAPPGTVQEALGLLLCSADPSAAASAGAAVPPEAGPEAGEDAADTMTIDLLVVEDWPGDLGVARAVHDYHATVLRALQQFTAWLASTPDTATRFYGFGSDRLPEVFDFAAAAEVVTAVTGNAGGGEKQ